MIQRPQSTVSGWAVIGVLLAVIWLLLFGGLPKLGIPITCDPPRHTVRVATMDGFGHTECAPPPSPTPGGKP